MNIEKSRAAAKDAIQNGYKMIFDDTEERYSYFALKAGDTSEIPRSELNEMINSGKPMPILEIKEKIHVASQPPTV
jgi:hypothetical protein